MAATKLSTDDVMQETMAWIFGDDNLMEEMEQFATTYCPYFDYIADRFEYEQAENKLVYTQLYQQFSGMFEAKIAAFLATKGWTVDEFLTAMEGEAVAQKTHSGEVQSEKVAELCDMITALTDYSMFKIMMLDQRKKLVESGQQGA